MKRVGIVYLITEEPAARGVLEDKTEKRRKTFCEERSLSMSETYQARASGHSPTLRLVLPQDFEYKGETMCEYRGERYRIIRDYRDEKSDSTELTLERERGNAAEETETAQGEPAEIGGTAENEPAPEDPTEGGEP